MGIFAFSSRSACAWIGVGEAGPSNPGFSGPEGSIRFIVSVPSCASSLRKSWTTFPERVRLAAIFRLACGERSALAPAFDQWCPRSFEPTPDDAIAGAFHEAGSDRQAALPAGVIAHSVPVGLAGADAVRDGFGPVAMRLQGGDDPVDPPLSTRHT